MMPPLNLDVPKSSIIRLLRPLNNAQYTLCTHLRRQIRTDLPAKRPQHGLEVPRTDGLYAKPLVLQTLRPLSR